MISEALARDNLNGFVRSAQSLPPPPPDQRGSKVHFVPFVIVVSIKAGLREIVIPPRIRGSQAEFEFKGRAGPFRDRGGSSHHGAIKGSPRRLIKRFALNGLRLEAARGSSRIFPAFAPAKERSWRRAAKKATRKKRRQQLSTIVSALDGCRRLQKRFAAAVGVAERLSRIS